MTGGMLTRGYRYPLHSHTFAMNQIHWPTRAIAPRLRHDLPLLPRDALIYPNQTYSAETMVDEIVHLWHPYVTYEDACKALRVMGQANGPMFEEHIIRGLELDLMRDMNSIYSRYDSHGGRWRTRARPESLGAFISLCEISNFMESDRLLDALVEFFIKHVSSISSHNLDLLPLWAEALEKADEWDGERFQLCMEHVASMEDTYQHRLQGHHHIRFQTWAHGLDYAVIPNWQWFFETLAMIVSGLYRPRPRSRDDLDLPLNFSRGRYPTHRRHRIAAVRRFPVQPMSHRVRNTAVQHQRNIDDAQDIIRGLQNVVNRMALDNGGMSGMSGMSAAMRHPLRPPMCGRGISVC